MPVLEYVGRILWLALPVVLAGIAHMGLVAADVLPRLKIPLDGGRTWRGRRILGDHKTLRGLVAMPVLTAVFFAVQAALYARFEWARRASLFDYSFAGTVWTPLAAGAVYGLGYALAELPNSFVKRRLDIEPGREASGAGRIAFAVVDQGDSVLGCLLALLLFWIPPWHVFASTLLLCTGLHLGLNAALYVCGLRKRPL